MPKCERCGKPTPSEDLGPMPRAINVLACPLCRAVAPHLKTGKKKPSSNKRRTPRKEDRVSKDNSIFSFDVFEEKKGDMKDYRFELNVVHSGVSFKFTKTMDEIRDFFTKRRNKTKEESGVKISELLQRKS